jgi:hypothetical protein
MGRVDTKRLNKVDDPSDETCYSRVALLQMSAHCSPKLAFSKEVSPWFAPESALYCLPLAEVSAKKPRPRAASEERVKTSKPNTVVLKNIPIEYTRTGLCEELARHGFGYAIDFLYLPIKASTGHNVGHAFINIRTKDACRVFVEAFQGSRAEDMFPAYPSAKGCQVSFAEVQGRDENMKKCSTVSNIKKWEAHEEWQPLFLDDYGRRIPMSEWQCTNGKEPRCTSTKNTPVLAPKPSPVLKPKDSGMQASAPEFVPQMELPLYSPPMRAEAKEFVPFCAPGLEGEMLPENAMLNLGMDLQDELPEAVDFVS